MGRLEAFRAALVDLNGETPTDFCESACNAWQHIAMDGSPPPTSPAGLIISESFAALAKVMTQVSTDWADTPDVRDRLTRSDVERIIRDGLAPLLDEAQHWLETGLPSAEQIAERNAAVRVVIEDALEYHEARTAEMDAEDAEAEADPYGAILIHLDPSRSDAPIFEKVCSLIEDDDERYRTAYEQLRKMLDSELLGHISDEIDRFLDALASILLDLRNKKIGLFDEDGWDERRRNVRSALISFTSALQSHEDQSIRAVRDTFGRRSPQEQAAVGAFTDLKTTSFEYRWLLKMRDALLHGDINAFNYDFAAHLHGENAVNVYMDRQYMFDFTKQERGKPWLRRNQLQAMTSDPSVLDMIKTLQPLMGPLQEKLDRILYSGAGEDAATVREFLALYPEGVQGQRALQNGPGPTRRNMSSSITPLAPRVLTFATSFEGWKE